jgi:hypothetical protein
MLITVEEAAEKIQAGKILLIAGEEQLLTKLPKGKWIAGTIPYFMTKEAGGLASHTHLFANEIKDFIGNIKIISYKDKELARITSDAADNGFSFIIIPANSSAHFAYAQKAPSFKNIFFKPILGWIAGIHLSQLGNITPKVFNGETGEYFDQDAIVMHVSLPQNQIAMINILNLFQQGNGDSITFDKEGFQVQDCYINGKQQNLAQYLLTNAIDIKLPLVADYYGTSINASVQNIDEEKQLVDLYAPIFKNVTYKIAAPISDYVSEFYQQFPRYSVNPIFSCNCILNYLYGELENKNTYPIVGPITFGEIAYQLLNQTLVYLEIETLS